MEIGYLGTAGWDWLSSRTAITCPTIDSSSTSLPQPFLLRRTKHTACISNRPPSLVMTKLEKFQSTRISCAKCAVHSVHRSILPLTAAPRLAHALASQQHTTKRNEKKGKSRHLT